MESVGPPTMWQGMNIRDILEKVELFNMAVAGEEVVKDNSEKKINPSNVKSVIKVPDPSSAYLGKGPKLWDKTISLPIVEGEEDDEGVVGAVMNLEEFLAENDLKPSVDSRGLSNKEYESSMSPNPQDVKPLPRPSIIVAPKRPAEPSRSTHESAEPSRSSSDVGGNLLKGENNFLYAESKRARMEREKEERRKKFEAEVEFAEEDIALATIPGVDFDPRERTFDAEELRPQPIIQKRQKLFVPDLEKDGKYWDKRTKNNVAARRSREARRLKENQIALRAAYLEKENKVLRKELDETQFDGTKLETERDILKMKLSKYEAFADR